MLDLKIQNGIPELVSEKNDIKICDKWMNENLLNKRDYLDYSLTYYLSMMYITWPHFVKVAINGESVVAIENPFNGIPLHSFSTI